MADILSVLYTYILKYDLNNEKYEERDRLIYSKGHAATILYSVLGEIGFIDKKLLNDYGKNNQPLAGHITHKIKGIEFSTGSLGHGGSISNGIALALKRKKLNSRVFVILSDGEMNEGYSFIIILSAKRCH